MQRNIMGYTNQKPICISLPGMEIHLTIYFFYGVDDRPPRIHSHPCHEIVCKNVNGKVFITLIPPLMEHFSTSQEERICSFLFKFTDGDEDDVCQIIRSVNEITDIPDTFDGLARLLAIKDAVQQNDFGLEEQLKAELRLFFVKMAQVFHSKTDSSEEEHMQTLDEERIALMEEFFNIEMRYPTCNKQQLAARIGVCERQLTRILKETYNSSFSAILLESRMNMAHAMLVQGVTALSTIAEAVGYTSVASFRSAYKKFFGKYPGKD